MRYSRLNHFRASFVRRSAKESWSYFAMSNEGRTGETADGFCAFKTECAPETWRFFDGGRWGAPNRMSAGTRWDPPARGDESGPHPTTRCPLCRRRLQVRATYNYGSGEEFAAWVIPEHKPRVTRAKSPKRQSKKAGRGK